MLHSGIHLQCAITLVERLERYRCRQERFALRGEPVSAGRLPVDRELRVLDLDDLISSDDVEHSARYIIVIAIVSELVPKNIAPWANHPKRILQTLSRFIVYHRPKITQRGGGAYAKI